MDFLGYVPVRVDRQKPLVDNPAVYLDRVPRLDIYGRIKSLPDCLGVLYLHGKTFVFSPSVEGETICPVVPVSECIVKG